MLAAVELFQRHDYEACERECTRLLDRNPYDQAAWLLKARALAEHADPHDLETDLDDPTADVLDDRVAAALPRPGTSMTGSAQAGRQSEAGVAFSPAIRPMTASGRVVTGYMRPVTASRDLTSAAGRPRPATAAARALMSSSGRVLRLGTMSMESEKDGPFINLGRLDLRKYAEKPVLSRALFDYAYNYCGNTEKALELASYATAAAGKALSYKDWWWKLQIGKCFLRMKLYRDAERHLKSSLKEQEMLLTRMYLCKVYIRLSQPQTAIDQYSIAHERHPHATTPLLGIARLHEDLRDHVQSLKMYKRVLQMDGTNMEALASIASNFFYTDQPEVAMRYYRRMLNMAKEETAELWNNIGLCAFHSQQYDLSIPSFERALDIATDAGDSKCLAEVWYNIGNVAINAGDLDLATECLKVAISSDNNHAESWNNLGVLEIHMTRDPTAAQTHFTASSQIAPYLYEPFYNLGVLHLKAGDVESSILAVQRSLRNYPDSHAGRDMLARLRQIIS